MKLSTMTQTLPMLALASLLLGSGCGTPKMRVVAQDRAVQRVKKDGSFTAPCDGWFVPDATWIDINEAIGRELAK